MRAFVATAQQDDDLVTAPPEIDAIAGAVVNADFTDATADCGDVPCETIGETKEACSDGCSCLGVLEPALPFAKCLSLLEMKRDGL
ncbi:hypothetical protein BHK69_20900 [Bosea vaviloviae]|uniref:Uncharacterized protein n=1 Tax=Bosea vaviloviae TaxID=1526658 RepID=A0A1D7U5G5_9HYPH|nr:hypothetical protein BHK69_20900 [Bosea vaviloviae]